MARIDMLTLWRAEAFQSVRTCWYVLHTRGNQCHLVTWIKTITQQWSCTQYSINVHLWQSPWMNNHTTRSRALVTKEDRSHSHKSPSYKVHNHPHINKQTYLYIYIYIYVCMYVYMHHAQCYHIEQENKPNIAYVPRVSTKYRKCKTDIAIPRECGTSKK